MTNTTAGMLGMSAASRAVVDELQHAARVSARVLITGECGAGKMLIARLIHEGGARRTAPFVTIDCARFSDCQLEGELFGYAHGSPAGGNRRQCGALEAAHGGTLVLTRLDEMGLRIQARLLRFLETQEIQRVGSSRFLPPVDVRVMTATSRRLTTRIADKTFLDELYYRLNVVHVEVPPLRERPEDVVGILEHFLHVFSSAHSQPVPTLSPAALATLTTYYWPGNVRELRNVAEQLVLRYGGGVVDVDHLPGDIVRGPDEARTAAASCPHGVLFDRIVHEGASFWTEVYEPFIAHDLTRAEIRDLVRLGLAHTHGNYRTLMAAFRIPVRDHRRFMVFLRTHECHVAISRTPTRVGRRAASIATTPPRMVAAGPVVPAPGPARRVRGSRITDAVAGPRPKVNRLR